MASRSLDAPEEIFATVLNYLGKDPNSSDPKDYSGAATDLLLKLRPNIRYFHSSQYINDLANGNICVAIGWSGDILQAKNRAEKAKNGVNIGYSVPKEGALAFFDMMAIPKDAKDVDAAYTWLNYIMDPKVIADVSNKMNYANGNKASLPLINADIRNNPGIYPTPDAMAKLFVLKVQDRNWIVCARVHGLRLKAVSNETACPATATEAQSRPLLCHF